MLGATSAGLCAALLLAVFVIYPWMGERKVEQALAKVGRRLGRELTARQIDVGFGAAKISELTMAGADDGAEPLLRVERISVRFRGWSALSSDVEVDRVDVTGVSVHARRAARGVDNFSDLLDELRRDEAGPPAGGSGRRIHLRSAKIRGVRVELEDEVLGARAVVADAEAQWRQGDITARARDVSISARTGQRLRLASVSLKKGRSTQPLIELADGEISLWPKMSLTGVAGTVIPEATAGRYRLSVDGGYGGVAGKLWAAVGQLDLAASTAVLDVDAEKFHLDRLEPILKHSYLLDYAKTAVDAKFHLEVNPTTASFSGDVHVRELTLGHPMLAERPVRHLDVSGSIEGTVQRDRRVATLARGDFVARGLPFSVTGELELPGGRSPELAVEAPARAEPRFAARLVIPPIACQAVLDAIPIEMVPYMRGYKLKGKFSTDLQMVVDYADLDGTVLDGSVGIRACKVKEQPTASPKRLLEPFEHFVEVERDQWISFEVGPDNPDFVPFDEISPHLVNSIMTTEDNSFMKHHGFIVSEFRSALIKNLKAGYFRYGASSITMQLVKNVLLYREKTLSRKLQELFFTWDVENTLEKERILEIYFNVIEYGPGLYGIGPAARHFFGKEPRDLNPVEAAFFSSILPAPKDRYQQYCKGTLRRQTTEKIKRILALMQSRGRITEDEYELALETPLVFLRSDDETERECLARRERAMRLARPTNPLKK